MKMDIARLSMQMSQADIMRQVQTSMMRMSLDQMRDMADKMKDMCNPVMTAGPVSIDPSLGQYIDFYA